jgi:hypothetical protein
MYSGIHHRGKYHFAGIEDAHQPEIYLYYYGLVCDPGPDLHPPVPRGYPALGLAQVAGRKSWGWSMQKSHPIFSQT